MLLVLLVKIDDNEKIDRPCAPGPATSMSIMVAMGLGATSGVLFKNAEAIEFMRKVDTLVVDKTGTVTEGKPKLVSVQPVPGFDELRLLRPAASVERASEHPLAAAVVAGAEEPKVSLSPAEAFESITGKGIRARVFPRRQETVAGGTTQRRISGYASSQPGYQSGGAIPGSPSEPIGQLLRELGYRIFRLDRNGPVEMKRILQEGHNQSHNYLAANRKFRWSPRTAG